MIGADPAGGFSQPEEQRVGLSGLFTCLRPLSDQDLPLLYRLRCDLSSLSLWLGSRSPATFEQFQQEVRAMSVGNMMLVFEAKETGRAFGFSQVAEIQRQHGHAALLVVMSRDVRDRRPFTGVEGVLLLQQYLFQSFPLRKLYADVLECHRNSWGSLRRLGWKIEGRYKEHQWSGDRFWDQLRLSIDRHEWESADARWRKRLERAAARRDRGEAATPFGDLPEAE